MKKFDTAIMISANHYAMMVGVLYGMENNKVERRKIVSYYLDNLHTLLKDLETDLDCAYRNVLKRPEQNSNQSTETVCSGDDLPALYG